MSRRPSARPHRHGRLAVTLLSVAVLWLFAGALPGRALDVNAAFDAANKLYEQGKFTEAAKAYEGLVQSGHCSATVYFNLGNAWFRAGQDGKAVVAYRRAELLSPREPNIRYNLGFVREKVSGFEGSRQGLAQRLLGELTLNEWTVLAVCVYWAWFLLLVLREARPSLTRTLRGYAATAGVMCLGLMACLAASAYQRSHNAEGVVVVTNAVVRRGPLAESPVFYQLPAGSELTVLDEKETKAGETQQMWLQVQDAARRTGWTLQDQVELIENRSRTASDLSAAAVSGAVSARVTN